MSICFLSLETSKVFNELIVKELEEKGFDGLSSSLIVIFPYLNEYKNISISNLAKKLGYTRQAMHKNLKKLEALEYIEVVSSNNKKEKFIALTSKSESLIDEANNYINKVQYEIEQKIGSEALNSYIKSQQQIFELLNSKADD